MKWNVKGGEVGLSDKSNISINNMASHYKISEDELQEYQKKMLNRIDQLNRIKRLNRIDHSFDLLNDLEDGAFFKRLSLTGVEKHITSSKPKFRIKKINGTTWRVKEVL